ncbi:MAG: alpha/beta fold hydrolase [Verrucomicrobia bacterium]|nr:alpha/beta fold hydrolase [Verrucomicrobiota bacterium]
MNIPNQRNDTVIVTEDLFVASDTAGIELHLRRKRPAHVETFPGERTLLLMHGATFSSGSLFDAPVAGASFMDQLAAAGFDVYAVDVRGYGASTRPPEMEGTVDPSKQPVRIGTAIRDLGTATDYILESRKLDQLNLVAMSWGGSIAGAYTAKNNAKIKRLALIAPLWLRETPGRIDAGGDLPAYREVDLSKYEETWRAAAPKDQRDSLIPPEWFEVWAENTLVIGPRGSVPNSILAPSGAIQDIREYWSTGRPFYDPGEIRVPVLLVHAEWDVDVPFDTARDFFSRLTAAPYRRWIEIGQGTHMVILEKNRWQVVNSTIEFLRENLAAAVET